MAVWRVFPGSHLLKDKRPFFVNLMEVEQMKLGSVEKGQATTLALFYCADVGGSRLGFGKRRKAGTGTSPLRFACASPRFPQARLRYACGSPRFPQSRLRTCAFFILPVLWHG